MPQRRVRILISALVAVIVVLAAALVFVIVRSDGTTVREIRRYVALGDSYTAAPLVGNVGTHRGCFRSNTNYPKLIAQRVGGVELTDVSCSGAQTTDMLGEQRTLLKFKVAPQFDALDPEADLVTIGIGGNDFGVFETLTDECPRLRKQDPTGSPCEASMQIDGEDRLLSRMPEISDRIVEVLEGIHERAPKAMVIIVGYPDIVPEEGTCKALPFAEGDYIYTDDVVAALNDAIEDAADRADATYIDVWSASKGHDMCADEPWVNGKTLSTRAASYHPFAVEQEAVAQLILEALGRA